MGCEGNCGPGGKLWQPNAGFVTHVTCGLTAKNRDQPDANGHRFSLRWVIEYVLPFFQ